MDPGKIQLIVECVAAGFGLFVVVICSISIYIECCKEKAKAFQELIIFLIFPRDFIAIERVTIEDGSKRQSLILLGNIVYREHEAKTRTCCFIAAMFLGTELLVIFAAFSLFKQEQGCAAGVINKAEDWWCFYEGNDFDCFNYLMKNATKNFRVDKVVCTKFSFSFGLAAARVLGTYKLVIFVARIMGKFYQKLGDRRHEYCRVRGKDLRCFCLLFLSILLSVLYIAAFVGLWIYLARNGWTNLDIYQFIEYLVSSFLLFALPWAMVNSTRKRYFLGESEEYPLTKENRRLDTLTNRNAHIVSPENIIVNTSSKRKKKQKNQNKTDTVLDIP